MWSQIRIEKLFLQLTKKKLSSIDKFPHWDTAKYWIPLFVALPPKIVEKTSSEYHVLFQILPPSFAKGGDYVV